MENNQVIISGIVTEDFEVSHTIKDEVFYKGFIYTKRNSDKLDKIPVIISNKIVPNGIGKCNVSITGEFRSRNELVNNKSKLILYVLAKTITENRVEIHENSVKIKGFVCKTPIYRKTPKNREITDLLIAVNNIHNRGSYIPSVVWGGNARFANCLSLGQEINIEGRIESREYTKDEQIMTAYELSVNKIYLDDSAFEPFEEIEL